MSVDGLGHRHRVGRQVGDRTAQARDIAEDDADVVAVGAGSLSRCPGDPEVGRCPTTQACDVGKAQVGGTAARQGLQVHHQSVAVGNPKVRSDGAAIPYDRVAECDAVGGE